MSGLETYCSEAGVASVFYITKVIFNILQIVIPVLLIISSIISLIALMTGDPDDKKQKKKLINKVAAAITIFCIPLIVNLVMGTLSNNGTGVYNMADCWTAAEVTHRDIVAMNNGVNDTYADIIRPLCTPLSDIKNDQGGYDYSETCEKNPKDNKWYQCFKTTNCFENGVKGTGLSASVREKMQSGGDAYNGSAPSDLGGTITTGMPIPLYQQTNYKAPCNGGNYSGGACGPTSAAMVESYLLGRKITPTDITTVPGICGNGWGHGSSDMGPQLRYLHDHAGMVSCSYVTGDINQVVKALQEGHPVIVATNNPLFTRSAHVIVLRGATRDGRIYVNDPAQQNWSYKKDYDKRTFTKAEISKTPASYFVFPTKQEVAQGNKGNNKKCRVG